MTPSVAQIHRRDSLPFSRATPVSPPPKSGLKNESARAKLKRKRGWLKRLLDAQFGTYHDPFTPEKRRWSRELFFAGDGRFSSKEEAPRALATLLLIALFPARLCTLHT